MGEALKIPLDPTSPRLRGAGGFIFLTGLNPLANMNKHYGR